jgi:hypothetical protein
MATYFGDLQHTAIVGQSVVPAAAITASANGSGVDMILGDANNFNAILNYGVYDIASGNETYVVAITESDDNITFVPLATPVAFPSLTSAGGSPGTANVSTVLGKRSKRYLRAEMTLGGTTPSFIGVVTFIERLKISGVGDGHFSA